MFQTVNVPDDISFSPILIILKPILILCKCVGICSLPIIKCTHLSQVKYQVVSFSLAYQIGFIVCCELNVQGVYKSFVSHEPLNIGTFFHMFNILLFFVCTITDRKLLDVLKNMDTADKQLRQLMNCKNNAEGDTGYKWVLYVVVFEVCIYLFIYCTDELCVEPYLVTLIYRQMPSLLITSLFCTISTELWKRFQLLKRTFQQNLSSCDDAIFLEECREVHCKLALSTELFCEVFGARVTIMLLLLTLHTISFFCFPCIHGSGCKGMFLMKGIAQQSILVSVICFHASQLDEKVSTYLIYSTIF